MNVHNAKILLSLFLCLSAAQASDNKQSKPDAIALQKPMQVNVSMVW